jgi:hypothetical protein
MAVGTNAQAHMYIHAAPHSRLLLRVQDGLQLLLWHTGRQSPSNSGTYISGRPSGMASCRASAS